MYLVMQFSGAGFLQGLIWGPMFFYFAVLTSSRFFEIFIQLVGRERKRIWRMCRRF